MQVNVGDQTPTPAPEIATPTQSGDERSFVTPQDKAPEGHRIVGREEKIEYRDQEGNLLNEEQVQALKEGGSATFQTRYETRTRMVDADGNEIGNWAPEHPDVEGQNPDTKGVPEAAGKNEPAKAPVPGSKSDEKANKKKPPKPASDANEATA